MIYVYWRVSLEFIGLLYLFKATNATYLNERVASEKSIDKDRSIAWDSKVVSLIAKRHFPIISGKLWIKSKNFEFPDFPLPYQGGFFGISQ